MNVFQLAQQLQQQPNLGNATATFEAENQARQANALKMAEMYRADSAGKRAEEDAQRAQFREDTRAEMAQSGLEGQALADQYLQRTGDVPGAQALRDQGRKNALGEAEDMAARAGHLKSVLGYAQERAKGVTPETYGAFVQEMKGLGLPGMEQFPQTYSKEAVDAFTGEAARAYGELQQIPGAPAGTMGQQSPTGQWSTVVNPPRTTETAAGAAASIIRGAGGTDEDVLNYMLRGERATDLTPAKAEELAAKAAAAEFKALTGFDGVARDPNTQVPITYEQLLQRHRANYGLSGGGSGTAKSPLVISSPEQLQGLPPGTVVQLPDGSIGRVPAR